MHVNKRKRIRFNLNHKIDLFPLVIFFLSFLLTYIFRMSVLDMTWQFLPHINEVENINGRRGEKRREFRQHVARLLTFVLVLRFWEFSDDRK
jgi:hypothetical protein